QPLAYLTQVQILSEKWSCWQYCGLTSHIYFCRRALQSPIPSTSGDASYNLVEWSTVSVKLPFLGQEIEKSLPGFFPNLE
ncbi:hypothetical protein DRQ11_07885, partial [candidate division KSB1 bacterium]